MTMAGYSRLVHGVLQELQRHDDVIGAAVAVGLLAGCTLLALVVAGAEGSAGGGHVRVERPRVACHREASAVLN